MKTCYCIDRWCTSAARGQNRWEPHGVLELRAEDGCLWYLPSWTPLSSLINKWKRHCISWKIACFVKGRAPPPTHTKSYTVYTPGKFLYCPYWFPFTPLINIGSEHPLIRKVTKETLAVWVCFFFFFLHPSLSRYWFAQIHFAWNLLGAS